MGVPHGASAVANDVGFSLSAEGVPGANQMTATIQLKINGSDVDHRTVCAYWLSSDANGDTLAGDPGTTAIGTDGTILVEATDDIVGFVVSEADGDIDFVVSHSSTSGFYINLAPLGSGRVFTSPILQFA